ncbi:MAG: pyridoxamine 5'-phosphate oxidase family protein [Desertimonas sp.]
MIVEGGLEVLSDVDSARLLAVRDVGRIGVTVGALPAIYPVNYLVDGGAILFRTLPGSTLATVVPGAIVAFEVDDYEQADRTGWSVLAVGQAEVLDADEVDGIEQPDTWAEGDRSVVVRIVPTFLSGRRLVHTTDTAPSPSR